MWVIFNLNNDSTQSPKITLQIIHLFFKRVRHNHTSVFSTLCTQQNTTRLSSSVYEIGEHIWGTFDNSAKHNLFRSLLVYYPLLFKPQMINLVQVWILSLIVIAKWKCCCQLAISQLILMLGIIDLLRDPIAANLSFLV